MIDEKEAKEEELRKQKERERIAFLSCKKKKYKPYNTFKNFHIIKK